MTSYKEVLLRQQLYPHILQIHIRYLDQRIFIKQSAVFFKGHAIAFGRFIIAKVRKSEPFDRPNIMRCPDT